MEIFGGQKSRCTQYPAATLNEQVNKLMSLQRHETNKQNGIVIILYTEENRKKRQTLNWCSVQILVSNILNHWSELPISGLLIYGLQTQPNHSNYFIAFKMLKIQDKIENPLKLCGWFRVSTSNELERCAKKEQIVFTLTEMRRRRWGG